MPLGFDSAILGSEIAQVRSLSQEKGNVFLLGGYNNDEVVVKADVVSDEKVRQTKFAMKTVDAPSKLRLLTPTDINELRSWAQYATALLKLAPQTFYGDGLEDLDHLTRQTGMSWVKMPKLSLLVLKKVVLKAREGDAQNVSNLKQFRTFLNFRGSLFKLGQIIAVDLFTSNRDRFVPFAQNGFHDGDLNMTFKALQNVGNVFMLEDLTQGWVPTGIDFIDPNSYFGDFNMPVDALEQQRNAIWPGRVLVNRTYRKKFAKDIVDDLEMILWKPSKNPLKTKLRSEAPSDLEDGMENGRQRLIAELRKKINNTAKQQLAGFHSRLQILLG